MYTPLEAEQTYFHAVQIVPLGFFKIGIVSFEQELVCFEIVAGVIFVGYGDRNNVYFF